MRTMLCLLLTTSGLWCVRIGIFNEGDDKNPDRIGILYEVEKSLQVKADIFVSVPVWIKFANRVNNKDNQKKMLSRWKIYNTNIGLVYLQHKHASKKAGISYKTFTRLKQPFKTTFQAQQWAGSLTTLFDTKKWQQYHRKSKEPKIIYMSGHGSQRNLDKKESVCSISADEFSDLLDFFDTKLNIDMLGVQSCYWPTARIKELTKDQAAPFGIITPLRSEDSLSMATSKRKAHQYCFFEAICRIYQKYNGTITPEIKQIANKIDTLRKSKNWKQRLTFIPAGSDSPLEL